MHCKPELNLAGSLAVFLCLLSCASQPNKSPFFPVYVTDWARFALLPPAEIEKPIDAAQQISGSWGTDAFIMNAWVRADKKGIEIELYNGIGTDMGHFYFGEDDVFFQSSLFPAAFKAEYLAADFQFCFYRPAALEHALAKCDLGFEIVRISGENGESVETRLIKDENKTIIEIKKTGNRISYENPYRGYSFTIREAE
jgi:hypothetical protein